VILNQDDEPDNIPKKEELEALLHPNGMPSSGRVQAIASSHLPKSLPIFPLLRTCFFPGMAAPILIEQGLYYETLREIAQQDQKIIALFLTKNEETDIYNLGFDDIYEVGVAVSILRIIPIVEGGAQCLISVLKRIRIKKPTAKTVGKQLYAQVDYHDDKILPDQQKKIKAYSFSIIQTIKEMLKNNPIFKDELQMFLHITDFTEGGKLADFAAALTLATRDEKQQILESFDIEVRIEKSLKLLRNELDINKLQHTITKKIEANVSKAQREFFLREQLKTIKKELGLEKDDYQMAIEKFEDRLEGKIVPEEAQKVINEELSKLQMLDHQSAEYSVCYNYLDWLTILPWGLKCEEILDVKRAEKILDHDHYGLSDIKERILEFISVAQLRGHTRGQILCFTGPPGVGKTSIGRSIASALNRPFYRFSVGGMRDEAEIKGHRRTYIGAMPGKFIQALKHVKYSNPVIMIDEVDKMGISYQGDPASALLEVLDPEQNRDFLDHYIDTRVDLSEILFIVTCNDLDSIPGPLRDRMEVLRLSGYIAEEKVQIAKRYLVKRAREEMGLGASQISIDTAALNVIVNKYSREAGVRNLEKNVKKICRKVAAKFVREAEEKVKDKVPGVKRKPEDWKKDSEKIAAAVRKKTVKISAKDVETYLGKPIFTSEAFHGPKPPVGVVSGLAWTAYGGSTLYIEAAKMYSKDRKYHISGNVATVMKESLDIAWTYVQSKIDKFAPGSDAFENADVHIHVPEGATPKDGPSAGITMTTALLSLLLNKPVKKSLAMTGEISLLGKVLAIGGVKEKLIAARRENIRELIFPKENYRDYVELPDYLKKNLIVHFVDDYTDVFKIAFEIPEKKSIKSGRKKRAS
jgi:ATP-dependent Lon protease